MSWKLAQNNEISEVRKAYGQTLEKMILEGRPVMVCDADLAGSSGAGYLYDKYPEHTVSYLCIRSRLLVVVQWGNTYHL